MNLLPLVVALLAGLVLVPVSIGLAPRLGLVVTPREDRWGARVIPMFGGLGVAGGIAAGVVAAIAVGSLAPLDAALTLLALGGLFVLGLWDDRGDVSPRRRLAVEAALGALVAGLVTADLPQPFPVLATLLGLLAVPAAVNATNLVDNADGLAASLSTITAVTLVGASVVLGLDKAGALPLAITGATLAFLVFNRPPARTFMGDAGSLPLGGALAVASILLVDAAIASDDATFVAATCVVLLAWTAQAADMALVITSRVRRGRSPFQGGTDHTSHRLLRSGLGPTAMLGVIAAGAALACLLGLMVAALGHRAPILGVAIALFGIAGAFALESLLAVRQPPIDAQPPVNPKSGPSGPGGPSGLGGVDVERPTTPPVRASR